MQAPSGRPIEPAARQQACGHMQGHAPLAARLQPIRPARRRAADRQGCSSLRVASHQRTSRAGSSPFVCRAAEDGGARPGEEVIEYKDSPTDIAFIGLCRKAYGNLAGWQSERDWRDGSETYKGMVEVSRALMKGKSAEEQQAAVIAGFPEVPPWFRRLFPYSKWGAEANAWITPTFFKWLVGPMERRMALVDGQEQNSAVYIKRCRYLAESGCAGMCSNLCKRPVQAFFTEQLGMPLTMKPNFEDYSCEMVFGERPPAWEEDEAFRQPCLSSCPVGNAQAPQCPKLR